MQEYELKKESVKFSPNASLYELFPYYYYIISFIKYTLFTVWMYFGLIGGFVFIIIQLILLIDFAHAWNETWVENMEEGNSKCWYVMLMGSTFAMFAASITGIALLFVFFTKASDNSCSTQKFIISFHLILCVIISVLSILPQVQERQPRSGICKSPFSCYPFWKIITPKMFYGLCLDIHFRKTSISYNMVVLF